MEGFYIIAVGYDQESKCQLLNAMNRDEKSFTTFGCRLRPVIKKVRDETIQGHTISLVLTPSLNTPAWVKVKEQFLRRKEWTEKRRIFVYVKADSTNADDKFSFKHLKDTFNQEHVLGIDCYSRKYRKNVFSANEEEEGHKDEIFQYKFQTDTDWSTRVQRSKAILGKFAKVAYKAGQVGVDSGTSEVGAEKHRDNKEPSAEDPSERKDTEELLSTVQIPESEYEPRMKEKLTKEDWDNFQQALRYGSARSNHVRVNVVGNHGVGKTTVIKRLLKKKIQCPDPNPKPTENLEVHRVTARCTEKNGRKCWETDQFGMFLEELNIQRMAQAMEKTMKEKTRSSNDEMDLPSLDTQPRSMSEGEQTVTNIAPGETPVKWSKPDYSADYAEKQESRPRFSLQTDLKVDTVKSPDPSDFYMGSEEFIEDSPSSSHSTTSNFFSPISSKSHLSVLMDKENYLRKILYYLDRMAVETVEQMYVSYWDYAGQSTYYATHQLFLSPSAVYLLVVDLRKELDDMIQDNLDFRSGILQSCTVADAIRFWARSVQAYTKDEHGGHAPFIVVGTHRGDIKDDDIVERRFKCIRNLLKTNAECIAIDNTLAPEEEANLDVLRNKIIDVGLGVIDEMVSSQWINLEYDMQKSKACQDGFLKFSKLQQLDERLDVPMCSVGRLEAFLCHQHYRGHLLFYHHPDLKDLIITDPMILVDFLNLMFRRPDARCGSLTRGWNEDGILDHSYIKGVAEMLQIEEFACMTLLKILVKLHILHPLSPDSTDGKEDQYFLPCLLKDKPTVEETEPDACVQSPVFQVRFDHDSIYQTTYHQIMCALMKSMSVIEEEDEKKIYNLHACFDVEGDKMTWLVLYWKNSRIDFYIKDFRMGKTKRMCQHVDGILDKLEQAIEDVLYVNKHENVSYGFWVACHKHEQSFLSLKQLKEKKECLCTGVSGKGGRHAVQLKDIPEVTVDLNKEQREDPVMLQKPNDIMLGRLAWKLATIRRETAAILAVRLKLPRAFTRADIVTRDYDDPGSELFHILVNWRNYRETDRTYSFLLSRLTKTNDYDHSTLKAAMFTPLNTDSRFDAIPPHVARNDKDIVIISDYIGKGYTFLLLEVGVEWSHIEHERRNNRDDTREMIRQLLFQRRRAVPEYLTTKRILEAAKVVEIPLEKVITELQNVPTPTI